MSAAGGIVLWIDAYSDIFSDFDPRPYATRIVSDDFIAQVRRASREVSHQPNGLRLLVPEKIRSVQDEVIIRQRLKSFFTETSNGLRETLLTTRRRGAFFALAGFLLSLGASYLKSLSAGGFAITFTITLFEPAGWFLLWAGFDSLVLGLKEKGSEAVFFKRMAGIGIEFGSY